MNPRSWAGVWVVSVGLAVGGLGVATGAAETEITGFRTVSSTGECAIRVTDPGDFAPIAVDTLYKFGATIRTGRNSAAVLEFSDRNRFRVLARTTVTVVQDLRNPNVKKIQLGEGSVALELDDFPKGQTLSVETPTAVCGAVGTRFEVSYLDSEQGGGLFRRARTEKENDFRCSRGSVFADSSTFHVTSLSEGTGLRAAVHAGRENSFTRMGITGGAVEVALAGANRIVADAGSSLRTAHAKGAAAPFVAVSVDQGSAKVGGLQVEGDLLVDGTTAYEADNTPKYLAAAEAEGRLQTELQAEQQKPQPDPARLAELEKQVREAAAKATLLRQNLTAKNTRRLIQQIRRIRQPPRR